MQLAALLTLLLALPPAALAQTALPLHDRAEVERLAAFTEEATAIGFAYNAAAVDPELLAALDAMRRPGADPATFARARRAVEAMRSTIAELDARAAALDRTQPTYTPPGAFFAFFDGNAALAREAADLYAAMVDAAEAGDIAALERLSIRERALTRDGMVAENAIIAYTRDNASVRLPARSRADVTIQTNNVMIALYDGLAGVLGEDAAAQRGALDAARAALRSRTVALARTRGEAAVLCRTMSVAPPHARVAAQAFCDTLRDVIENEAVMTPAVDELVSVLEAAVRLGITPAIEEGAEDAFASIAPLLAERLRRDSAFRAAAVDVAAVILPPPGGSSGTDGPVAPATVD